MTKKKGFTYIELLLTLALLAVCFIPFLLMFSRGLGQMAEVRDLATARYLAREGMERFKNLNFTKAQFKSLGDVYEPPLLIPPWEINGARWRMLRKVVQDSDPLVVRIRVFREGEETEPMVEIVTLMEDWEWAGAE